MLYEFKIDTNENAIEDLSYLFRFDEPDADGQQTVTVLRAEGDEAQSGIQGEQIAQGRANEQILLYMAAPHTVPADEPTLPVRAQAKAQVLMQSLGSGA